MPVFWIRVFGLGFGDHTWHGVFRDQGLGFRVFRSLGLGLGKGCNLLLALQAPHQYEVKPKPCTLNSLSHWQVRFFFPSLGLTMILAHGSILTK